jgi:hypothetical protein
MNAAPQPCFAPRAPSALYVAVFILLVTLAVVSDSQNAPVVGAPKSPAAASESVTPGLPSWWHEEEGDDDDDDDELQDDGEFDDNHEDADQLTDEERYLGTYSSMLTVPAFAGDEGEDEDENVNENDATPPVTATADANSSNNTSISSSPINSTVIALPPMASNALRATAVLDKSLSAIVTKCRNMYYTGGKAGSSDPQQDRPGAIACVFYLLAIMAFWLDFWNIFVFGPDRAQVMCEPQARSFGDSTSSNWL